ncbi:MAG: ATP synthase F0 subunit B [Clostridiales bacterium]|jgi:F-type H+-transporting ATPase subunit b|nr:ATP synthase F0 subunit B [Clostridiales bacterium]
MGNIISAMDALNISLKNILLHFASLAVLVTVVYFLLFKRIKQFMKRRSDEYQTAQDSISAEKKDVEEMKAEYSVLLDKANNQIARINEEAAVAAELQAKVIIEEAKNNAKTIVEKANKDMQFEKAKMKAEFKNEVADIAVDIAGKILMREVKSADTEKVIEDSLNEWVK